MPIFEYVCSACEKTTEHLLPYAAREAQTYPCDACPGEQRYAGLSAPSMGREQFFGVVLKDGRRIRGNLRG